VTLEVYRKVTDDKAWVCWTVTDTGIGIAKENYDKLFKSFSQVDSSATRRHDGTGLGLAISKNFCEKMGGTIGFSSEPGNAVYRPHSHGYRNLGNRGRQYADQCGRPHKIASICICPEYCSERTTN